MPFNNLFRRTLAKSRSTQNQLDEKNCKLSEIEFTIFVQDSLVQESLESFSTANSPSTQEGGKKFDCRNSFHNIIAQATLEHRKIQPTD